MTSSYNITLFYIISSYKIIFIIHHGRKPKIFLKHFMAIIYYDQYFFTIHDVVEKLGQRDVQPICLGSAQFLEASSKWVVGILGLLCLLLLCEAFFSSPL
jgi:hypothetical protein